MKNSFAMSVILLLSAIALARADWATITIGTDARGHWECVMENSKIKLHRRTHEKWYTDDDHHEFIYVYSKEIADGFLGCYEGGGGAAKLYSRKRPEIIYDGADRKTVRFVVSASGRSHDVSIFPGVSAFKVDYTMNGDYGYSWEPGFYGIDATKYNGMSNEIYGAEEWLAYRKANLAGKKDMFGEHLISTTELYPPYPNMYYDKSLVSLAENPLNYRGMMIHGNYLPDGRGICIVMPMDKIEWYKLPSCGDRRMYNNTSYYIPILGGGADEILAKGKKVAEEGVSGDTVPVSPRATCPRSPFSPAPGVPGELTVLNARGAVVARHTGLPGKLVTDLLPHGTYFIRNGAGHFAELSIR